MEASRSVLNIPPIELDGQALDIHFFLTKEYDDVDEASVELPALIEWISSKLQGITEQMLCQEDLIKKIEAETWFYLQNGGFEDRNYAGKKTATALTMAMRLDDKVNKEKTQLSILIGWKQRLENLVYTLRSKMEIVRSVEATRRSQLSSKETQND